MSGRYSIRREGVPIEDVEGLPAEFIKACKDLGHDTAQSLFGASVALRVGERMNAFGEPYGLTHKEIHELVGAALPIHDLIRLSGPIPKYATGVLKED